MNIHSAPLKVYKHLLSFVPDMTKVITRFFVTDMFRTEKIINRISKLTEDEVEHLLQQTVQNFSDRHYNIKRVFKDHFDMLGIEEDLTLDRKLLIGSYFTMEYAVETAALLNPSIIPHPDQSGMTSEELRVILSFRAVGEGHMSSIVFREGHIDKDGELTIIPNGALVENGKITENVIYLKDDFILKLKGIREYDAVRVIMDNLLDNFTFNELQQSIRRYEKKFERNDFNQEGIETILWLARSNYELEFREDLSISGRVIFPRSKGEIKALEDARFVRFVEDDGSVKYYATYTAYDGHNILPELIETRNFYRFRIMTLMGHGSQNKGMALFPEKINGKYAMISRNDNENLFIMYSDNIRHWEDPVLLKEPEFYWEFYQIGNNGSPIKTERGWLLLTHGVGPVRTYCIGAILLDLENPAKIIGRVKDPILFPEADERDGYVPNVVYSCGSIIHNDNLIMPYAISDTRSGVAKLNVRELLDLMEPVN